MNKIFKSKRNRVWLENGRVHKLILSGVEAAQFETEILEKLFFAGVKVPRLLVLNKDKLIMEYVKGISLTEEIDRAEAGESCISAGVLAECITSWFASFYAVFPGKIKGDVNCRNFIVTPEACIYGVDFEDLPNGQKEIDAGRMSAFILNYNPPYTDYKKRLASALIDCFIVSFGVDRELVLREQAREIETMRKRRKNKF